jgi:hypothetical protein
MKINKSKTQLLFAVFVFFAFSLNAQELTQTVRGKLLDTDSKAPIPFANIQVVGSDPLIGAVSDFEGNYTLKNVPIGRITLKVSYIGYEERIIPNILVISGKETVLDLELKESFTTLGEVTVTSNKNKSEAVNEMVQISSQSLSVEESQRYAGGIGDPARLVSSFAGVASTGDGNNDIIVRGNNPRFIQWKLEGTEIPSPNHFSQEGLTGGPISALNSQMLANSDFFTGAFAPEYGNALSGIFDMRLRKGNNEKREYSLSVGVLGTDLTAEGPFKKGGKSSYLFNYRYSTLALISKLGILDFGGVPIYQDMSFKIVVPTTKFGTFTAFGLGGLNKINSAYYAPDDETLVNEEYQQRGRLGVIGVRHFISLNDKMYFNSTLSHSINGTESKSLRSFNSASLQEDRNANTNNHITRLNANFNYKLNNRHLFKTGLVLSTYNYNFDSRYYDIVDNMFRNELAIQGNAHLVQSFLNWKWRATEKLSIVTGIHSQKTSQNTEITFEPRASMRYNLPKGQAITAGIGFHSNMTSLSNYHTLVYDMQGNSSSPNKSLELLKARHYVLGYENRIATNLFFKVEAYYQDLYDIPVEIGNSSFSLINQRTEISNRILVNEGKGRNVGLELTLEKYFSNSYYFLITASLFDSKYKATDGVWRNTRFNGNYIANALFGKEFKVGRNKNYILGVNTKIMWMGGNRLMNIDLDQSLQNGYTVYDEVNAFRDKGDDVFSLNVAMSYRINKSKISHEFKIDIQNVTNNKAIIERYYSDVNKRIEVVNQLSLLPILSYTLNF